MDFRGFRPILIKMFSIFYFRPQKRTHIHMNLKDMNMKSKYQDKSDHVLDLALFNRSKFVSLPTKIIYR